MRNYAPSRGLLQVFARKGQWIEFAQVQFEHPTFPGLHTIFAIRNPKRNVDLERPQGHRHAGNRIEVLLQTGPACQVKAFVPCACGSGKQRHSGSVTEFTPH